MSEKTEQPTPRKLEQARKKGQVPKSKMFSSAAILAVGACCALATAKEGFTQLATWTQGLLSNPEVSPATGLWGAVRLLAVMSAPALCGAFLAALATAIASAGFRFLPGQVAPQLERIDPLAGFKRLFSIRQLVEVLKGLVVAGVFALLVWNSVGAAAPQAFRAMSQDGAGALAEVIDLVSGVLVRCLLVGVALGAGDYLLARRRHVKDLMMTREEIKQEHKESEGNPHHKGHRRALQRELAASGPARGVKKASVVVVNPTHIAVALRYESAECESPYLVAKGRESRAFALRREAEALGIPVVRDVPLARALIHYDLGDEIPEELYRAAAAVLRVAFEKNSAPVSEGG